MNKALQKSIDGLIGKSDQFEMEGLFFNIASLVISILGIANGITEYYLGLSPKFYVFALVIGFCSLIFYLYGRWYKKHRILRWPLITMCYIVIVYDFYLTGGLSGIPTQYAIGLAGIIPVLMKRKEIFIAISILLILLIFLFLLEVNYPLLPSSYPTEAHHLQDILTTCLVVSIGLAAAVANVVKNYQTAHKNEVSNNLQLKNLNDSYKKKNQELNKALNDIDILSGLLPICSHCKKIRDDKGYWNQIEDYISRHSEAKFSHGICKACAKEHYPDINIYDDEE